MAQRKRAAQKKFMAQRNRAAPVFNLLGSWVKDGMFSHLRLLLLLLSSLLLLLLL